MCEPHESLMVSLVLGSGFQQNSLMNYKLALGYCMKIKPQSGEALGLAGAWKWTPLISNSQHPGN